MELHLRSSFLPLPVALVSEDFNNNHLKNNEHRRCLFGKSDPTESILLFEEQMKMEQERFLNRYEVTEEDAENMPLIVEEDKTKKQKVVNNKGKSGNRNRKVLMPYLRQPSISDYYQSRKVDRCEKLLK